MEKATKPGRWLRAAFTERLAYKAAALFFAIALWVFLRVAARP